MGDQYRVTHSKEFQVIEIFKLFLQRKFIEKKIIDKDKVEQSFSSIYFKSVKDSTMEHITSLDSDISIDYTFKPADSLESVWHEMALSNHNKVDVDETAKTIDVQFEYSILDISFLNGAIGCGLILMIIPGLIWLFQTGALIFLPDGGFYVKFWILYAVMGLLFLTGIITYVKSKSADSTKKRIAETKKGLRKVLKVFHEALCEFQDRDKLSIYGFKKKVHEMESKDFIKEYLEGIDKSLSTNEPRTGIRIEVVDNS